MYRKIAGREKELLTPGINIIEFSAHDISKLNRLIDYLTESNSMVGYIEFERVGRGEVNLERLCERFNVVILDTVYVDEEDGKDEDGIPYQYDVDAIFNKLIDLRYKFSGSHTVLIVLKEYGTVLMSNTVYKQLKDVAELHLISAESESDDSFSVKKCREVPMYEGRKFDMTQFISKHWR